MGIKVEFNPDLALRSYSEFEAGRRKAEECIPKSMKAGDTRQFLKEGQRNYWLEGEIPLLETKGNSHLSMPIASIVILECTHFLSDGRLFTRGKYRVAEVFAGDGVRFNGFTRI